MANGLLGKKAIPATSNQTVYTVPATTVATMCINVCNRTLSPIKVRLSIGTTIPSDDDVIEYDVIVPANGTLERTGLVASAGESVVAYAASGGISVRVMGFEETA